MRQKCVADGNHVNIRGPGGSDGSRGSVSPYWIGGAVSRFQEIAPPILTVPETDTGGLVEYTKALERTILKELGKLHA